MGHHLIPLLLKDGARVRVIARSADTTGELQQEGVEFVAGSIADKRSIYKACKGVDGIFHLAGSVIHSRYFEKEVIETNVVGTMNVMEAAASLKLRVVYASTSGVVGCQPYTTPWIIATDDLTKSPYCIDTVKDWPYYKSKIDAEIRALSYAKEHRFDLIVMRPSMMLGPGDVRLRSTSTVLSFLHRKLPFTPCGGVSFVDIRDAAAAFKAAMEKGKPYGTYLLASKNCSLDEWFRMLEHISGVRRPMLKLPKQVSIWGATLLDLYHRKMNDEWNPSVDPVKAEMACHYWNADSNAAIGDLGFKPRSPTVTLKDTVDWLKANEKNLLHHRPQTKKLNSKL